MRPLRLVVGLLLLAAAARAEDPAPAADAPVVRLDHVGGFGLPRKTEDPWLEIRADGTLVVTDPTGTAKRFEARVPLDEWKAVLRWILEDKKFESIDQAAIERKLTADKTGRFPGITDASSTQLEVVRGAKRHRVTIYALGVQARNFPEVEPLQRLHEIAERLEHVHTVARAGGRAKADALLAAANAALKEKVPDAAPFPIERLSFTGDDPTGARTFRLARLEPKARKESKNPALTAVTLRVAEGKPPTAEVYLQPES